MALELSIATGSSQPIYRQIVDQVCMAIAVGQLDPGDAIPSVRVTAERLVINPNTVARAYAELARDGFVLTQPGKGLTVAPRRRVLSTEERHRRLESALDDFVRVVAFLDLDYEDIFVRLGEKLAQMLPLSAGKETK